MIKTPRNAVILTRISDARDELEEDNSNGQTRKTRRVLTEKGVADQERRARAHADRLGWKVKEVLVENDTSAFKRRKIKLPDGTVALRTVRPEFRRALDMLVSGEADGLIALDLDRVVRDPRDLEDLIDVVENTTPRPPVTSVTGSLRLENDGDITMARVLVAVSNKESRDKARRIAAARERDAIAGKFHGGIRPFGYEADGLTVRPDEAAWVVRCTEAILGGVSLRSVVKMINEAGVRTTLGNEWTTVEMRDMLRRARNAGKSVHKGEVVGDAQWPAIVPESSWRAVCAHFADPSRKTSPGNQPRWLGSGIYRCRCGDTVICSTSGSKRNPHYRCRPPRGTSRKPGPHVTRAADQLDEYIQEIIIERLSRKDAVDLLDNGQQAENLAALQTEAVALRRRLDEQAQLHAEGIIDTRQLVTGSKVIRTKLDTIEKKIEMTGNANIFAGLVGAVDVRATWFSLDLGQKRAILDSLLTVTLLPARQGRNPDGKYFDRATVRTDFKR